MCVTFMFMVFADSGKFLPYMIANHKACLRNNCLEESLSDANLKVG
jgi:hypothetical protein